jgi:hypothetical protein
VQATVVTRSALAILLGLAAALGACGGDGGGFSGDPDVPEGWKTYSKAGVSFAYPSDWQVAERTDADGAPAVEITPPEKAQTPYGLISLSFFPDSGDRFDSLADQRRIVVKEVNDGKIESDDEVDVPGADQALRAKTATPPGRGTDPVEVRSDSLDVLRGDDVIWLIAASPEREGQSFDATAVIDSFRLEE